MSNNSAANKDRGPDFGWQIKKTNSAIKRQLDAAMARILEEDDANVTGVHGMILHYLASQPDTAEVFQRDLEKQFNIGRSTVTGILQLMEQNGLIERQSVPQDARLKKLVLTEKARRVLQDICDSINETEQQLVRGISAEELATATRVLERIRTNLAEIETCEMEEKQ